MLTNRSDEIVDVPIPATPIRADSEPQTRVSRLVLRRRASFFFALVLVAFVLRAGAAVVVDQVSHATGNNGFVERDDQSYDGTAWLQAQAWRGEAEVPPSSYYLLNVYTYTQAGLYYLIGHHMLAMKLLNCLFGALTAGLIYLITRQFFGQVAASFSGVIAAFFPSTFFYSLVNFKDPMFILMVAVLLWFVSRLLATARLYWLLPMLIVLALVGGLRPFTAAQLGLVLPLAIALQSRTQLPRKWVTAALALVGCVGVLWLTDAGGWFGLTPAQLNDRRFMMAAGGKSSYIPTPVPPTPIPPTAVPTLMPPTTVPIVAVATVTAPAATTPKVTTAGAIPRPDVPPAAPTALRTDTITASSIELLWDDNSDNESGFEVLILRDGVFSYVDIVADMSTYTLTGLPPGTNVTFSVHACNTTAGCSDWSNYIAPTTAAPATAMTTVDAPAATVPTAPIIPPPSTTDDSMHRPVNSLRSLLLWLPTGLLYVLAAPFPWAAHRLVEQILIPEMLLWYAALACAAVGLAVHWRRWRQYAHLLGYLAATLLTLGIVEGNLGTLVRQRGMIIPFVLIFSGAGAAWLWSRWQSRMVR